MGPFQSMRALFRAWSWEPPADRVVIGEGDAALRSWAEGRRLGPWRWLKLRPETGTVVQWEMMLDEMRSRQKKCGADLKEERERSKRDNPSKRSLKTQPFKENFGG